MDFPDNFHVEGCRRHEVRHLALLEFAQDIFHARRPLEGCYEFAAKYFALREMQAVVIGKDNFHALSPS